MLKLLLYYFVVILKVFAADILEHTTSDLANPPIAFHLNQEKLIKPSELNCKQWLELLEIERNKADCISDYNAFKAFTKEISLTIGGKYGIWEPSNQDDLLSFIYSVIRTRHKFCGKLRIFRELYEVSGGVAEQNSRYFALLFVVDALAMITFNDEDDIFFDQWTAARNNTSAADIFVEAVKSNIKISEEEALLKTLNASIEELLKTGQSTIATVQEVLNIFSPKVTLRNIYEDMVGGKYRGWIVHGVDAFARLTSLGESAQSNSLLSKDFLATLNARMCAELAKEGDSEYVHCVSVLPISSDGAIEFRYVYKQCIDILSGNLIPEVPLRYLSFTKGALPEELQRLLKKYECTLLEERLLQRYKCQANVNKQIGLQRFAEKRELQNTACDLRDDIDCLADMGDSNGINNKGLFLFEGTNGFEQNMLQAFECFREAKDLGNKVAKNNLSLFLYRYSLFLVKGENGVKKDLQKAVDFCKEAKDLGYEAAIKDYPNFLNEHAAFLFEEGDCAAQDLPRAIELLRESKSLGSTLYDLNLATMLDAYAHCLLSGIRGVKKDIPKSIELFKESATLGFAAAQQKLPRILYNYAVELFKGINDVERNIPKSIAIYEESAIMGFEGAKQELPIAVGCYALWLITGENGVEQNLIKGIETLRQASALGHVPSQQNLPKILYGYASDLFHGTDGAEKNIHKAVEVLKESSALGCVEAKISLPQILVHYAGSLFSGQNEVEKNIPIAIAVFKEAIDLGSDAARRALPSALTHYGLLLAAGEGGLEKNETKAKEFLREAAALGEQVAINILNNCGEQ